MLSKDFENFELRLIKLREESWEHFEKAEKIFEQHYKKWLERIFPRDVLWAKKYIAGYFEIAYVDELVIWKSPDIRALFESSVGKVIRALPLSGEKQKELRESIIRLWDISEHIDTYITENSDISRDPFFALVEDFSMDGDISQEEFVILKNSYEHEGDFIKALESLPESVRNLFHRHIAEIFSSENTQKREAFESEYSSELALLQKKGLNIEPVIIFVSRVYYRNPGKLKRYEHPKRRLRRTFKLALLRLLRAKLGNIDAEIFLKRFEEGESFEDFFTLLYKLLEVIDENPSKQEVYSVLKLEEKVESLVYSAEETKQKILEGDKVTANISSLIGETDASLEEWLLEKVLDDDTHFHGDEIHFAHGDDDMAWIYASQSQKEDDDELDDIIDEGDTLRGNYERLKEYFREVDEEKRQAFLEWNYDEIDIYNEKLMRIESRIEKIWKLLWEEM